jgi:hypothetical protein
MRANDHGVSRPDPPVHSPSGDGAGAASVDGVEGPPLNPAEFSAWAAAQVQRELAEAVAADEAMKLRPSRRSATGPSTVFTVRLGNDELVALERRAALNGIKPSVQARNLIRIGLAGERDPDRLSELVEQLADLVAELRERVS